MTQENKNNENLSDHSAQIKYTRNTLFIVRTTAGQEINVALLVETRTKNSGIPIFSILSIPSLRGYVVMEARNLQMIYEAIRGLKHVKGKVSGTLKWEDLESMVKPRPLIDLIQIGEEVEVVAGPFRGMKAKITAVDKSRNEVSLNILEANYPLTITVPIDYIRPVKGGK